MGSGLPALSRGMFTCSQTTTGALLPRMTLSIATLSAGLDEHGDGRSRRQRLEVSAIRKLRVVEQQEDAADAATGRVRQR